MPSATSTAGTLTVSGPIFSRESSIIWIRRTSCLSTSLDSPPSRSGPLHASSRRTDTVLALSWWVSDGGDDCGQPGQPMVGVDVAVRLGGRPSGQERRGTEASPRTHGDRGGKSWLVWPLRLWPGR